MIRFEQVSILANQRQRYRMWFNEAGFKCRSAVTLESLILLFSGLDPSLRPSGGHRSGTFFGRPYHSIRRLPT